MHRPHFINAHRPALLGLAGVLGLALAGCASAGELRRQALQDDRETCARFGTRYGSPEYSECMLVQQQRRDDAPLRAAEQQRLSAEAARNNLEMVRRMRCEREAKRERENGGRPRPCR